MIHAEVLLATGLRCVVAGAEMEVEKLREAGVDVVAKAHWSPGRVAAEVEESVSALLKTARSYGPVRAILNAVQDEESDEESDTVVVDGWGKALGAWLLHKHSSDDKLDAFVLVSSTSSLVGNARASDATANCLLEELARHRRSQGLPATCIIYPLSALSADTSLQKVLFRAAPPVVALLRPFLADTSEWLTGNVLQYTHRYFLAGSFNNWKLLEMRRSRLEDGLYEVSITMPVDQVEFQIVRDGDWKQVIHPMLPHAKSHAPILGPDDSGQGLHFLISAYAGDTAKVTLRMVDGQSTVITTSPCGSCTFRGFGEPDFMIVGSFNRWRATAMKASGYLGLWTSIVTVGPSGQESFQILGERLRFYPEAHNARSGESRCMGPDGGEGVHWRIEEKPGTVVEVSLNLNEYANGLVTWIPVL